MVHDIVMSPIVDFFICEDLKHEIAHLEFVLSMLGPVLGSALTFDCGLGHPGLRLVASERLLGIMLILNPR